MRPFRTATARLAASALFDHARALWERNQKDYLLPLSKLQKLYVGSLVIMDDYSKGLFPPNSSDREAACRAEAEYFENLPGNRTGDALDYDIRKPFQFDNHKCMHALLKMCRMFAACGVNPPQRLLELGAGTGWMCEILKLMGFDLVGTTIGKRGIEHMELRRRSISAKGLPGDFGIFRSPMEEVDRNLASTGVLPVDAVYVFEALHHAFDWRQTLRAAHQCLKPGGWFFICKEPNVLHTFISYRLAKLAGTHEVGFRRRALVSELGKAGFSVIRVFDKRPGLLLRAHWIAAQR